MRHFTSVITVAAGSALLAATTTFAAPADGLGDYQGEASTGAGTNYPSMEALPPGAQPVMDGPSPYGAAGYGPTAYGSSAYGPVWAGYQGDRPGTTHQCECDHCGRSSASSVRKLFDKFSAGMSRMLPKKSSPKTSMCQCARCEYQDEPSCAADSGSACDAMGPVFLPGPPMMQHIPSSTLVPGHAVPSHPIPSQVPSMQEYPSAPHDPFQDDPVTSQRQLDVEAAGYFAP